MSNSLWSVDELVAATGGSLQGKPDGDVTGISIDTRTIGKNEAYFAIKGDVHDGHAFVSKANENGASLSVVARAKLGELGDNPGALVIVEDVLIALEKLGRAARDRSKARIIAITGSVGKTTTKETLRLALAPSGAVHASVASFNNHWGVPLTLARMPRDADFGIFEIGMNHPGEITPLVQMVRPHIAMINNVAAVHLGAFNSVDDIAHAKAEIFDGLDSTGIAVLNADDERLGLLTRIGKEKGVANIVTFGEASSADSRIEKLALHGTCSCLTCSVLGDDMMVKIGTPGRHMVQNAVAVLAIAKLAGADLAKAGLALASLKAVKGRGERHKLDHPAGPAILYDESYNANPTSMKAALSLLQSAETKGRGRKIAILGDMLELGPTSGELHAGLATAILEAKTDIAFLAGPEMAHLHKALAGKIDVRHAEDAGDFLDEIKASLNGGDVITVKASLGMRFARIIEDLLKAFPPIQ